MMVARLVAPRLSGMSSCTVEQKSERLVAQTMALFEQNQAALIDFVGG
jgi:hypothetical protein